MSITGSRTQSAGVGASDIDPIYRTSAFLNVGTEFEPRGLALDVISIPASRMRYGIEPSSIASALQGERGGFSAYAPTISHTQRLIGQEALPTALAWTVTAAAARANNRMDLDPTPGGIDGYAATWGQISPLIEAQILGAASASLFVTENSPPAFHSAANLSGVGIATVSYAAGEANAATLVVASGAIFVLYAAPIAGRAFGQYLADLIEKLPGSNAGPD